MTLSPKLHSVLLLSSFLAAPAFAQTFNETVPVRVPLPQPVYESATFFQPIPRESAEERAFRESVEQLGRDVAAILNETPQERAFREAVEALGKDVADILSNGTIGETPEERAFREAVEELGREVSAILNETAEQRAFREAVEELGRDVSRILSETPEERAFREAVEELGREISRILNETPEERALREFQEQMQKLAQEVADALNGGTIGDHREPTIQEILSTGVIGDASTRYSQTKPGPKPAASAPTSSAVGAGMSRD